MEATNHRKLYDALVAAMRERPQRPDLVETPDGLEVAWVLHERQVMADAVNAIRAEYGFPPADPEALRRAERQAEGHSDYAVTFAAGCALLAVQEG